MHYVLEGTVVPLTECGATYKEFMMHTEQNGMV